MKAQAYPPSVIRKGAVLYAALYYIFDDDKAKVEVTEWIVRSIQKRRNSTSDQRYVNLAQKLDGITWGKRSRKNGDFGWLPSIPSWCLKQFREGGELPFGVYTTRLAALKFAKVSLQEEVQYCEAELKKAQTEEDTQELQEELAENQRLLKAAGAMVKREQNKKKRG
ncbi:hypothetical protein PQP94_24080 (plasmid) [Salmonella enterica subsp. enterica serovar Typhimurium]|uniref:hypothetical protein n=1 Tax=Salmonella enterica TaxID=28901 RepID=UPI0023814EBF|nr:hypothetical protein [Salmonella enterica]WDX79850.1 hypothetical protein PQP94_24080 [Salmonella enterica subsp. enterica serovar Typhimurium]